MNLISYIIVRGGFFLVANPDEIGVNTSNWSLLNTIGQFFYLGAIFVLIILMAVFSLKFAARFRNYSGGNNNLRIIETKSLGAQNFVHIIKAGNKYILVGTSKENVTLLTEVDRESIADVFENKPDSDFDGQLSVQIKKLFKRDIPPEE